MFRDAFLPTTFGNRGYLGYHRLPVSSDQPVYSPLTYFINEPCQQVSRLTVTRIFFVHHTILF